MYYDETVIRDRNSNIIYKGNPVLFVHPENHMMTRGIVSDFTTNSLVRIEYQVGDFVLSVCVNPRNIVKN